MTCCDTKQPTSTTSSFGACAPGALAGGLTRTRFFDGMVLTQADLENEQRFWRVKRRLTNRTLGTGVVWGLRLRWDARRRQFSLGPGYALDCCGNDLIVECPLEIAEAELFARADPSLRAWEPGQFERAASVQGRALALNQPRHACVVLQYVECPEGPRPVQVDACTPPSDRCEPSRVRETVRLSLAPPPLAQPSCLDDLLADLDDLKRSIRDPQLRAALFPANAAPAAAPAADALLPATLRVVTPGVVAPGADERNELVLQPPAIGSVAGTLISGRRKPSGLRAGIVQFELRPLAGWGFSKGEVKQGDTVVDMVSPPIDLQQFWSLEVTLPRGQDKISESFAYQIDGLAIEQLFGEHPAGSASLMIRGRVTIAAAGDQEVVTQLDELSIDVKSTVGQRAAGRSCFEGLFPWGAMAEPEQGADHLRVLLLAAIYAYFADVTQSSGGAVTQTRLLASLLYTVAWRLLGVDLTIANAEAEKQELARILARLFQCWCDAMVYPGPRCTSEHHGVYLGCATISPNGQILSFDMWEQRRHVLTGPLLNHWLGVFGLAPADVVAGRLAQAICCVAGLPLPTLATPGRDGLTQEVPVGRGQLTLSSRSVDTSAREVGLGELVRRVVGGFVAESPAPLARFRTRLDNGLQLELVAPSAEQKGPLEQSELDRAVGAILSRASEPLRPLASVTARTATAEIARELAPTLRDLSGASAELAKALAADGVSLAGVLEAGPEGLWKLVPEAEASAIDELLAHADAALSSLAEGVALVVRKAHPERPATTLREASLRKTLASELSRRFNALTRTKVDAALERAAARVP